MKLIDAMKLTGNPYYIPDCSRDDLPDFFTELRFKIGAEIGVSLGRNLELYCKAGFQMYGIDHWSNDDDHIYKNVSNLPRRKGTMEDVYNAAIKRLSRYPNCTLIRKTSMDALRDIPDCSLDFVYIDGNHMYGYVAMDLMAWSRKVRKGGIIAGHDYYHGKGSKDVCGVKYAVDGFVKTFEIENLYVLGRQYPRPGEIIERTSSLSFMCFKHW